MFFERTIDSKSVYEDNSGNLLYDLGEQIFKTKRIFDGIPFSMYRVNDTMVMRADLMSIAAYGDGDNTELLLKYNNIQNPFTLDDGDVLIVPSQMHIENNVGIVTEAQKVSEDALIRNYHKFVDKSKLPNTVGSEKNTTSIPKKASDATLTDNGSENKFKEANLANLGATAIKEIDGKLYFGADSNMKCAADGMSTADYLKTVVKNSISNLSK